MDHINQVGRYACALLVAMFIGGSVGLASGFFGGRIDTVLMRFTDYILVSPAGVHVLVVRTDGSPAAGAAWPAGTGGCRTPACC